MPPIKKKPPDVGNKLTRRAGDVKTPPLQRSLTGSVPNMPRKPYRARKRTQMMDRQAEVAALYLEGRTHRETAQILGITDATVAADLERIRQQWLDSALIDFDARKAQELAKIDHLESECWRAWQKSTQDSLSHSVRVEKVRKVSGGKDGAKKGRVMMDPLRTTEETIAREQNGDPRFLERIAWCIETRVKILGIMKPGDTNVNQLVIDWDAMVKAASSISPTPSFDDVLEKRILEASSTGITSMPTYTPLLELREGNENEGDNGHVDAQSPHAAYASPPRQDVIVDGEEVPIRPKVIRRMTHLGG